MLNLFLSKLPLYLSKVIKRLEIPKKISQKEIEIA